uniref:Uncharacterized protein n=1 Tax=Nicotiana tabacum TaxID=4097 RepID=A0A1S4CNB6_TOBAC|nr:PREDICTED: uncharacterized protein LOC107820642 [Nicotiana tabacum]
MAEHNQDWHLEDSMGGIAYGTPSLTNMIKENQERDQICNPCQMRITKKQIMSTTLKVVNKDYPTKVQDNKTSGGLTRKGKAINSVEAQVEVPIAVEAERLPKEVKVQEVNREEVKEKVKETPKALAPIPRPPPPFPHILARRVDDSKLEKFYDILKQLLVNIPFVEAFQQMSGFAIYLRDLITKNKITKNEVVNVAHRVSYIIATTTVQMKEDPGAFTIPCTIEL